ncbi:endonuclease/exonuclease/phosphatase family protein [Aurantiacibacter spongiae]|uniref:Endonuclease n=1 Tax=Aurantiacibacter spongiae TaxID=2488860 RepID=A0A3N5CQI9_9SPHN|nr:endonuclease/exonuclease/phosphatase family protein [Aurantiacibacter spongiae]RPF71284.1 endonuclease [Aurantiacibacter spongiae]
MRLTFASYNIHKGIGADRRRDPARIMAAVDDLGADIVALQEVDLRLGSRRAVLDEGDLHRRGWQVAAVGTKQASMGWHGNAILVRDGIAIDHVEPIDLPALEPRGALRATVTHGSTRFCVTAMHLDLSGLRRRRQFATLCEGARDTDLPAVMMGDCNAWGRPRGELKGLADYWSILTPGPSFPARRPALALDRLMHSPHWHAHRTQVPSDARLRMASDHLPIRAELELLPVR